jgi:DNA invertase Pin-like site-specific DNA recombinase
LSCRGERLDTRNSTSKPMLTILAGVATREREVMLERQSEGIAKVGGRRRGKYKGRTPTGPGRLTRSRQCMPMAWERPP